MDLLRIVHAILRGKEAIKDRRMYYAAGGILCIIFAEDTKLGNPASLQAVSLPGGAFPQINSDGIMYSSNISLATVNGTPQFKRNWGQI